MPDLTILPLDELIRRCPPLTQLDAATDEQPWHELQRRAFAEQNDAAWDAFVAQLWPSVLTWIYTHIPDIPPAAAEQLAQQAILTLCQQQLLHFSPSHSRSSSPQPVLSAQISQILSHLLATD